MRVLRPVAAIGRFASGSLVFGIQAYRYLISPLKYALLGPQARCRFVPSCSLYALEAVTTHGPVTGTGLAIHRLCRCHPWGGDGVDLVPPYRPFVPSAEIPHP